MTSKQDHEGAKSLLIIVSLIAGLALFFYRSSELIPADQRVSGDDPLRFNFSDILTTIPLTVVVFILYPVVGAFIVALCRLLRSWGHKGNANDWDKGERIFYAAVWPITLCVSVILYPSLGIINRLFRD